MGPKGPPAFSTSFLSCQTVGSMGRSRFPSTVSLCTVHSSWNSLPGFTRNLGFSSQLKYPFLCKPFLMLPGCRCLFFSCPFYIPCWNNELRILPLFTRLSSHCEKQFEDVDYDLSTLDFHNLPQYLAQSCHLTKMYWVKEHHQAKPEKLAVACHGRPWLETLVGLALVRARTELFCVHLIWQ